MANVKTAQGVITLVDIKDGKSRITLELLRETSSSANPSKPSGTFTYNISSGELTTTGSFGDWTDNPGSVAVGGYLWRITKVIEVEGSGSVTFPKSDWSAPAVLSRVLPAEEAAPPVTIQSTTSSNGVTTVLFSDGKDITIQDGTSEGVIVVYASNANGADKNLTPASNLQYVRYYEWTGTKPALSEIPNTTNGWVKFVGETPNAPDAQGIIPVYSNEAEPSSNDSLSLTHSDGYNWVTFLEYTGTRPSEVPANTYAETFVPFVGGRGNNGDPAPRYTTRRVFNESSSQPSAPVGTVKWSDLSVTLSTASSNAGWTLTAPTIEAGSSNDYWFSDFNFIDANGTATNTQDTGTAAQKSVTFDGLVTFTNTGDSNGINVSDGTTNATVLTPGSVGASGSTEINGGRITANSLELGKVKNSGGATNGDQSGMLLTNDKITIQDASGTPRIILGKLT